MTVYRLMTVSHHMLRRTARKRAKLMNRTAVLAGDKLRYEVEKTHRGPWRWRVVAERPVK